MMDGTGGLGRRARRGVVVLIVWSQRKLIILSHLHTRDLGVFVLILEASPNLEVIIWNSIFKIGVTPFPINIWSGKPMENELDQLGSTT